MKTVTISEFTTNPYKYLNEIPLTLTKRGKPFAVIQTPRVELKSKNIKKIAKEVSGSKIVEANEREPGKKYEFIEFLGKYKEV